jgi:hypothetical protein
MEADKSAAVCITVAGNVGYPSSPANLAAMEKDKSLRFDSLNVILEICDGQRLDAVEIFPRVAQAVAAANPLETKIGISI